MGFTGAFRKENHEKGLLFVSGLAARTCLPKRPAHRSTKCVGGADPGRLSSDGTPIKSIGVLKTSAVR
jgi:hypothetical protein